MNKKITGGVMPAFITPFTKNGKIIESSVRELIDYHLESGMDGLYVGGSTGEGLIMTPEDRKKMAELVVSNVGGRVPVIIHVGSADTATACDLAAHAEKIGADGISSVPPYYYKMSKAYIKEFYTAISRAAQLPLLIYNIPMLTGVTIGSDFMVEMMDVKNIIGLKFTDTNFEELRKIKAYNNGEIIAFSGYDAMLLSALILGVDGGIGSFYNVMPKAFAAVYDNYKSGNYEEARAVQWEIDRYIIIIKKYLCPANQPAIKAILKEIGIDCGTVMPPLQPLSDLAEKDMIADLKKEGFFEFIK